ALVIGGAPGLTGAIVLAARAAARSGAGYVRAAVPASLQDLIAAQLVGPMVFGFGEDEHRALTTSAGPALIEEAARADARALGSARARARDPVAEAARARRRCAVGSLARGGAAGARAQARDRAARADTAPGRDAAVDRAGRSRAGSTTHRCRARVGAALGRRR